MTNILVIGSSNVDLIAQVEHLPQAGETVGNAVYSKVFGGKGANQAVAAARNGGNTTFVSSIGTDGYSYELKEHFQTIGMNIEHLHLAEKTTTGVALILVDKNGENCIAVAPGANAELTTDLIDEKLIEAADIVLMQLEIPLKTVKEIASLTKKYDTKLMLNPAPAIALDEELLKCVDYLVVNELEANLISGLSIKNDGLNVVAEKLHEMGSKLVFITLGKNGSYIHSDSLNAKVPSYKVETVDSTAAGDTFCGALAVGLSTGIEILEAVKYASAASAISVTRLGAQDSIPSKSDVEDFITNNNL